MYVILFLLIKIVRVKNNKLTNDAENKTLLNQRET